MSLVVVVKYKHDCSTHNSSVINSSNVNIISVSSKVAELLLALIIVIVVK